jgi:hypothetical protein
MRRPAASTLFRSIELNDKKLIIAEHCFSHLRITLLNETAKEGIMKRMKILFLIALTIISISTLLAQDAPPRPDRGDRPQSAAKKPPREGNRQQYSIDQAISDQAQLHTIAFSGLAFMTGDFGSSTFIPPGKVSDFFGFQYMRDIDAADKGHNPIFLDRVAGNVMKILSEKQRGIFEQAAREQEKSLQEIALKRMPLIAAFHRQLSGDLPTGSAGLDRAAVMAFVSDFFVIDAKLAWQRAKVFGAVVRSLDDSQKQALGKMKFGDFNSWPEMDREEVRSLTPRGASKLVSVGYMTFASEFFSWYAGSVEADTYFCPERHGTYFGGFYMKDMPAMGQKDFNISTSLTGDAGASLVDLLDSSQRSILTGVLDRQRSILRNIIGVRREISIKLRGFLTGDGPAESDVVALGRRYGEMDGNLSYEYAMAFAQIYKSMNSQQKGKLAALRTDHNHENGTAFIYSDRITMSKIPDSAFLFGSAKGSKP